MVVLVCAKQLFFFFCLVMPSGKILHKSNRPDPVKCLISITSTYSGTSRHLQLVTELLVSIQQTGRSFKPPLHDDELRQSCIG